MMNAKDVKLAMGCDHNYLWSCRLSSTYGKECTGPCKNCTTTQLRTDDYICPICDSPASEGYCANIKCVNHG